MNSKKDTTRILFIGKQDDYCSKMAADFISQHFLDPQVVFSVRNTAFPKHLYDWEGDLLISYLGQWIIPGPLLERSGTAAINFHPGPPAYPGIGCTNFAIYNGEKEFGVTCHHMLPKVDSGPIIAVRRFPVFPEETVYSMTQRCYAEIWHLFYEIMSGWLMTRSLPRSDETWTRKPYTRKQLNALCELTPDMDGEETARRIRATTYGDKVWSYMRKEPSVSYSSERK